jgi:glycosyltransferase involved in cell wall biosynthesis
VAHPAGVQQLARAPAYEGPAEGSLKIAVWHNLPSGGGKRALYEHIKGLKKRGHVIEAWCPSSADTDYLPLGDLVQEHVVPFEWTEPPSDGAISNVMYPFRGIQSKLSAMDRTCRVCADQMADKNFDLLFANSCMFFRVPAIGRMLRELPKVLYLQEPYRWLYEALPTLPWLTRPTLGSHPLKLRNVKASLRDWIRLQGLRLQAAEERSNAETFDQILVNSFFSRESVLRAYGLDAVVCYLGISVEQFRRTDVKREQFVIGVGSLTFEKGVDIAIRAIAAIPKAKRPDLTWIANVTSRPYYEQMKSLADSLDVRFSIKTKITDKELIDLLSKAALMIYTSRLEPFGLAPLEANACGTPVVAVGEGGVRESIQHMTNGLLVPDRNPVALGRAIQTLIEDTDLAQRLGSRGREEVRLHWTWEAAVDRLEALLMEARAAAPAHR